MHIRKAEEEDFYQLVRIWHDGWQDAHANIFPEELMQYRTLESFQKRLPSLLPTTRVMDSRGKILGFHITRNDELYQFYVCAEARGQGVAKLLLADVERAMS